MAIRLRSGGQFLPTVKWGTSANVSFTGTSAQSAVLGTAGGANILVRLSATQACRILEGANPTAVAASTLLPAGVVEFVEVTAGNRLAVIQDSAAGTLNITICDPNG